MICDCQHVFSVPQVEDYEQQNNIPGKYEFNCAGEIWLLLYAV